MDDFVGPQMPVQPVQPVTAAGPDHSKSLEKPELYSSLFQGPDQTKAMPSTSTPSTQIYPPANNFTANRPSDAYRYEVLHVLHVLHLFACAPDLKPQSKSSL